MLSNVEAGGDLLPYIVLATVTGGVLSVIVASVAAFALRPHWIRHLLSFAVGAMLAAALVNMLPEAVEAGLSVEETGWVLMAGLLFFFLIEKCALWRHDHAHGLSHSSQVKPAGPMILVGDAFHNFADGVVIAAAFLHDPKLGVATTIAVIAHEIPQEVGDFMVLLDSGFTRRRAIFYNALCGFACVVGGVLGYFVMNEINLIVPYAIALAAASFIYIAMSDLIPELHNGRGLRPTLMQFTLIALGIAVILAGQSHSH